MMNPQEGDEVYDSFENLFSRKVEAVKEEFSPEEIRFQSPSAGWLAKSPGFPSSHSPIKSLHDDDQELPASAKGATPLLKAVKKVAEEISDSGESPFSRFTSVLQPALQGENRGAVVGAWERFREGLFQR